MGVLYGRVFDDTTGLAIAGATVTLVSTSITATTDAQGRYTIAASEGPGTLACRPRPAGRASTGR